MVPELSEECFVGVVIDVDLGIGNLEVGTRLCLKGEKMIAKSDQ